ncbi:MAG TPA: hypothetical protein VMU26_03505 [Candidatus Polarisedimenticolia bacterium]|nr:hypothetical protein [Candidatus Polarisedimenticolia bacterium]
MKFADKYELFEAVTTGRLETFIGEDVARGERVLVHIFDAPMKKADQPTVLWVLESFRAVAPEPPGLVIATGRYAGTSYAYLVSQVPDDLALQQWKRAYESSIAETREIPLQQEAIAPQVPAANTLSPVNDGEKSRPASASPPANPPTGFFGLGLPTERDSSPSKQSVKLGGTSSETGPKEVGGINFGPRPDTPRTGPGEFTKQFFVGSLPAQPPANQLPLQPAAPLEASASSVLRRDVAPGPVDAAAPKAGNVGPLFGPVDGALPDLGGFTALFRPSIRPDIPDVNDSPKRVDAARNIDASKASDFTKFFQGPFDGERSAEIPDVLPNLAGPPQGKVAGEFTQIFGSGKDSPFAAMSSSISPVEEIGGRSEPGSFTRSFAGADNLSSTVEPRSIGESKGNGGQKAPVFPEPNWTQPVPSLAEAVPDPSPIAPKVTPPERRPSIQGGATQLFSAPGGHSAPSLPPPPTGPSEYTRIISGGLAGLISSEEQPVAEEGPAAAAGGLPAFKMPAQAVPAAPKIAAPQAPKLPAAPAAPKLPPVGALAPKPKASHLPMIIILNVSLIAAVLLIVYFAIKH